MSAGKARWADLVEEVLNPPHSKSRAPKTAENTWSEIVRVGRNVEGFDLNNQEESSTTVKITMDDIQEEVNF